MPGSRDQIVLTNDESPAMGTAQCTPREEMHFQLQHQTKASHEPLILQTNNFGHRIKVSRLNSKFVKSEKTIRLL